MKFHVGWYVVYVKPRHEKKICSNMELRFIKAFMPVQRKASKWHDRIRMVDFPLFPGYLFVFVDSRSVYFEVLKENGVLYYVKSAGTELPISPVVIESLQRLSSTEGLTVTAGYIPTGTAIVVTEGAMKGMTCEVVTYQNSSMIVVRVALLQRTVLAQLSVEAVQPLTS